MDTQKLLISLGDALGHDKVLKACQKTVKKGLSNHYLNNFVTSNSDGGCNGHGGDCGTCRDDVWYPCTEENIK